MLFPPNNNSSRTVDSKSVVERWFWTVTQWAVRRARRTSLRDSWQPSPRLVLPRSIEFLVQISQDRSIRGNKIALIIVELLLNQQRNSGMTDLDFTLSQESFECFGQWFNNTMFIYQFVPERFSIFALNQKRIR